MSNNRSIASELIRFSLPLIMSGILQQLYSWADAFIVGHAEGELQLGSIGATTSISMFLVNTIIGLTYGLSIRAAHEFGRGNREKIRNIMSVFLPVLCILYIFLAIPAIILSGSILQFMDTPDEMLEYSLPYLRIILAGIPFLALYNLYTALLRALGNTKAAFYSVLISSVLNVLLDILFVAILRYGVEGAAAATLISQISMTIFIIVYASVKYPDILRPRSYRAFDKNILKGGLSYSLPPAFQNSVISAGNLILQNFMNSFGAVTVLAITTAYRVDTIMLLPILNLGAAVSTMTAQSKGSGDADRIKSCLKSGLSMMTAVSISLALVMFFFGSAFVAFFGVSGEALSVGRLFFKDLACFYVLFGIATLLRGVLEGIGDITFCSIVGIIVLGVRIAFSYILDPFVAGRAIAFAEGISWTVFMLIMILRILHKKKDLQ
ncbi:MAG: MATE family efflux transporter [Firmicutes bacterium]|nr:MATE family efflux transporter [Bacillota bacterium]